MNLSRFLPFLASKEAPHPSAGQARAVAYFTPKFFDIAPCALYRFAIEDRSAVDLQLPSTASDDELGAAVRTSLDASHAPPIEEFRAIRASASVEYESWVARILANYKYKSRRALFREIKSVLVRSRDGVIAFIPTQRDKAEGFSGTGFSESDHVIVGTSSTDAELGQSLRLAISRSL